MPPYDGVRLHEHHGCPPVAPASGQGDPKQSVAGLEVRLGSAFHRRELLPQRQVLQNQFPMAAERQRQRTADYHEQLQHASIVAGVGPKINAGRVLARDSVDHSLCRRRPQIETRRSHEVSSG